MSDIKEFLTNDHRACDEAFAAMEDAVAVKSSDAERLYENFSNDLTNHFSMEEISFFFLCLGKQAARQAAQQKRWRWSTNRCVHFSQRCAKQ